MLYEKKKKDTFVAENAGNPLGEMLEWLKRHAWKACIRQKCIAGSNPALSAEPTGQNRTVSGQKPTNQRFVGFFIAYKSCFQDNKRT